MLCKASLSHWDALGGKPGTLEATFEQHREILDHIYPNLLMDLNGSSGAILQSMSPTFHARLTKAVADSELFATTTSRRRSSTVQVSTKRLWDSILDNVTKDLNVQQWLGCNITLCV